MDNLEYLKKVKDSLADWDVVKKVCEHEIEYRKMKALEIIAEELCIMNNPKYEVTIAKPKIQLNKKALGYIKKTSATKIKKV